MWHFLLHLDFIKCQVFSSPEPKAQVSYCHSASSVRPSSGVNFQIFDFSETTEQILTKLNRKQELNVLYQVCVFVPIGNPRWPPWPLIDWNIFRLLLRNRWMDFDETWQDASHQRPLSSLCFSCRSEIQDGRPRPWLAETFFGFFSTTAEWIFTKLDRKQVLNALYQFCVFRADRKSKMAALASDWLKHFSTSSPQPLNGFWRSLTGRKSSTSSTKFVFYVPIGNPRWPPWPLIGWNIFRLLLRNRWMNFDEVWQDSSPQHPLPSLCFTCRSEIQDCRPGLWFAETFFGFFSTTAEWILTKLDRKQFLTALYQFCVFRADRKSKMAALASDWLKHFSASAPQPLNGVWRNLTGSKSSTPSIKFVFFIPIGNPRLSPWPLIGWNIFRLLLRNRWMHFDETWQETSPQRPLPSLCFSCRSEIQDCRPGLWLAETFFGFCSATAELILTKLDRKQFLNALYQFCVFRADRKSKMAVLASDWLKHFSTSPQPLNAFWRNLTGNKSSTSSTKFVFFVPIGNPRWPPWPLIGWNIFRLLRNRWIDFDETWQEAIPQSPLSSLWPLIGWNIFRLLLHNRWMDFDETW